MTEDKKPLRVSIVKHRRGGLATARDVIAIVRDLLLIVVLYVLVFGVIFLISAVMPVISNLSQITSGLGAGPDALGTLAGLGMLQGVPQEAIQKVAAEGSLSNFLDGIMEDYDAENFDTVEEKLGQLRFYVKAFDGAEGSSKVDDLKKAFDDRDRSEFHAIIQSLKKDLG